MAGRAVDRLAVWWDDVADGAFNMAADEVLAAEALRRHAPLVRFYGWMSPTVSLGAFQPIAEARASDAVAGVALVRRPSGGGALVHGTDLTYALAVPKSHPWGGAPQPLYDAVHAALVAILIGRGVAARLYDPGADGGSVAAQEPFLCFARRAAGDVVAARPGRPRAADDPKVMGSAQRRLAGVVIQHGSLLLAANRGVGEPARHPGLAELGAAVEPAEVRGLAGGWIDRFAGSLGVRAEWEEGSFRVGREREILLAAGRFQDPGWLLRR